MDSLRMSIIVNKLLLEISLFKIEDYLKFDYFVIGLVFLICYLSIYCLGLLVLELAFYLINRSKLKKGDIVKITNEPWKDYYGKITKVGIFKHNIKLSKTLNKLKRVPKKVITKSENEFTQT